MATINGYKDVIWLIMVHQIDETAMNRDEGFVLHDYQIRMVRNRQRII